jgi:putative endonuclease
MWKLYIILCDQKTFYVGITGDLEKRLAEHRNKESFFTKKFYDLQLVYSESFTNKTQAAQRERQLKGWSHVKKEKLINKSLF